MKRIAVVVLFAATFTLAAQTPSPKQNTIASYDFASTELRTVVPFELIENEPLLQVRFGGSEEPHWVVLDSGAGSSYLDSATAKRMGLESSGSGTVHGAGSGAVPVQYVDEVNFILPSLHWRAQNVKTADLSSIASEPGRRIEGILGYDFISRFVIAVDYQNLRITIADPAGFTYAGKGLVLPIKFRDHWPYIPGEVAVPGAAPVQVQFLVDTGSGDAVDDPVILKSTGPTRKIATGVGLGQPTQGAIGRGTYVQFGTYRLNGPMVSCCGANPDDKHKIGGEVLRRFTVIFDYPHQRMILEPNRHFAEPFPDA